LQLNPAGIVLVGYPMKTLFVLLAALLAASSPARPPNVVVIFIDDMGYGDIGPFGATKQRTPHLDRMAKEGMKLTSFYAAPVCSVSRAQMMTGCYGARISVPGVYFPGQSVGLNPSEVTVAERLKEKGYNTQMVGIPAHPAGFRPLLRHPLLERHAQEERRDQGPGRTGPSG
jgi:arylsulfatase A-like enzyme